MTDGEKVFAVAMVVVAGVCYGMIHMLVTPKCYISIVSGYTQAGKVEARRICKTEEEAKNSIPVLMHELPDHTNITYVNIWPEGRGWFCE